VPNNQIEDFKEALMERVENLAEEAELKTTFLKVFCSCDPFQIPFNNNISAYMIFYPTDGFYLNEKQYNSLLWSAIDSNDKSLLISETEWGMIDFDDLNYWKGEAPDYEFYRKTPIILENALYSTSAKWGALLSHEDHAIVGGSPQFIEKIKSYYPAWQADEDELRRVWKNNANGDWVDTVLNQIHS
jgi:hypothetical protein